ncbi:hypothetical protein M977_04516 [Buttiauxella gaviniae ATCC 51604]|uniref:Uncharacterized protein n=1 Tax=Buttiauxella gaviniae ATCC 51604 TaxID=1354253 RepID=A0A1B7HMD2_9ENTR|nr:hypothetical protein [Buttiauxella gaviniae]OAT16766.1 hypothetical protein M977_04516 [Buttiauxella gaviniae ATCC 51604]
MQLVKVSSAVSALLSCVNAAIILWEDVFFGVKSSQPIVSIIVSLLFVVSGMVIWLVGSNAGKLAAWVSPEGLTTYKQLSGSLTVIFVLCGLIMLSVIYGLATRIGQGFSIFG